LRCLTCGYNLTGLDENRCPECGQTFDREFLLEILAGKASPVPGWDDASKPWPEAFVNTCMRTWLEPVHFGQRFPLRHVRRQGLFFRVLCLVAAVAIYLGMCLAVPVVSNHGFVDRVIALAIPPGVMVGALVCEVILAAIFCACLRRGGVLAAQYGVGGFISWRGLVGYYRSFLIVSATMISPIFVWSDGRSKLMWVAIAIAIVWWWHSLHLAVLGASLPGRGRFISYAAIPLVAVASIALGFVASIVAGFMLYPLFAR
jgi:hypothetical protein